MYLDIMAKLTATTWLLSMMNTTTEGNVLAIRSFLIEDPGTLKLCSGLRRRLTTLYKVCINLTLPSWIICLTSFPNQVIFRWKAHKQSFWLIMSVIFIFKQKLYLACMVRHQVVDIIKMWWIIVVLINIRRNPPLLTFFIVQLSQPTGVWRPK